MAACLHCKVERIRQNKIFEVWGCPSKENGKESGGMHYCGDIEAGFWASCEGDGRNWNERFNSSSVSRVNEKNESEEICSMKVSRGDGIDDHALLKSTGLKSGERLKSKAVSAKVTHYDAAHQTAITRLQRSVAYYRG